MKINIIKKLLVISLLILCCWVRSALGVSYALGLSHYSPAERTNVFQEVLLFILEGASAGDHVTIYDAQTQQAVVQFTIPGSALLQASAKARAVRLKSEVVALKQFLFAERVGEPGLTAVIDLPRFLDLAGTQLRSPNEPLRVIVIASPFYVDPDSGWNMQ